MTTLLDDWKATCATTDECSSGWLKHLARWLLNKVGRSRNYGCGCVQHDFDYHFGPKHGISKWQADSDLRDYILAAGHCAGNAWAYRVIAAAVFAGLTAFGWYAWWKYRRKEKVK